LKKNYLCTLKKIYIEEKRLERKPFNWRGKHGSIPEGVNVWLSVIGKIVTLNYLAAFQIFIGNTVWECRKAAKIFLYIIGSKLLPKYFWEILLPK
jgi:hypothetical protein